MIPWARFGVEAILIIASILAAFAIEAWWDSRSDRNEERVLLGALAQDAVDATYFAGREVYAKPR